MLDRGRKPVVLLGDGEIEGKEKSRRKASETAASKLIIGSSSSSAERDFRKKSRQRKSVDTANLFLDANVAF